MSKEKDSKSQVQETNVEVVDEEASSPWYYFENFKNADAESIDDITSIIRKKLKSLGFNPISHTLRMYKGKQPNISMNQIYGLACLELG